MLKSKRAFTIVELVVVIAVIAILVGVMVVGYGMWRQKVAETVLKSDLQGAAAQLERHNNWGNGYPEDANDITKSDGTQYSYTRYEGEEGYCLEASSETAGEVRYIVSSDSQIPREGECEEPVVAVEGGDEEEGELDPIIGNGTIPGSPYTVSQMQYICETPDHIPVGYTLREGSLYSGATGTSGKDIFYLTDNYYTVDGGGGDDIFCLIHTMGNIRGGDGNDLIYTINADGDIAGGGGNDVIYDSGGLSHVHGDTGDDIIINMKPRPSNIYGDAGDDTIYADGSGPGDIDGGAGYDKLRAIGRGYGDIDGIEEYF